MQQGTQQEGGHSPGLSIREQAWAVAALAVIAGLAAIAFIFVRAGFGESQPAPAATPNYVTFTPTSEQRDALHIQTVGRRIFHTEIVTDGYVAPNGGLAAAGPGSGLVARGFPILAGQSADVLQAESDLVTASAQFRLAQANEARQHQLFDAEGAAQKDWQQSQFDLASAGAALASARNRLRILGKTDDAIAALEKAPPAAQDNAEGAAPVFSIGDISALWLVANVREADAALVHAGDQVEVHVPAYPQQVFHAALAYVAPVIDPTTHRLVVGAEIRNPDGKLKPNMLANFTIMAGPAADAPAIPQSAIVYEGDSSRVWVADPRGNLRLRPVTIGRTDGGYAEVTGGLAAGEQIVTSGALFVDQAAGNN